MYIQTDLCTCILIQTISVLKSIRSFHSCNEGSALSEDKKTDICFLWITIEEEEIPLLKVITDALNMTKLINESIVKFGCKEEKMLGEICAPDEAEPRTPRPQLCPEVPTWAESGGPGGKGRKKRQSGPGPDLGPEPPPWPPGLGPVPNKCPDPLCEPDEPPPADEDFKRDAEFLKQLMSLDILTRSKIGHR